MGSGMLVVTVADVKQANESVSKSGGLQSIDIAAVSLIGFQNQEGPCPYCLLPSGRALCAEKAEARSLIKMPGTPQRKDKP